LFGFFFQLLTKGVQMSKSNSIDFSDISENEVIEKYWTPPTLNYGGQYGAYETIYATANYLSIGDVGDPDWREARRLPFGDEALEALYPGNRALSFIQYPWEHPDADTDTGNPVKSYLEKDSGIEWVILEMNKTEVGSERYNHLSEFLAEARDYNNRQVEEEGFIHAPSWAMDAIIYSQEHSYNEEHTKLIEEFLPKGSQAARVISSAPYADGNTIETMRDIHHEYTISFQEKGRLYTFALKDGKKTYGPYGGKINSIKFYRGKNTWEPKAQEFRLEEMYKLLHSASITPIFNSKMELERIQHPDITLDNLKYAKENYSLLANAIHEANFITGSIVGHIRKLEEDIFWETLDKKLRKDRIYSGIRDAARELNLSGITPRQIGKDGMSKILEDFPKIQAEIETRIQTPYYVLNVGRNTTVAVTPDKTLADMFKTGSAEDLLYFMLPDKMRIKLGSLEDTITQYGYDSEEYRRWKIAATKFLTSDKSKYTTKSLQEMVCLYNINHKVKVIRPKTLREYGWLLAEIPFTRTQINLMSSCLDLYGKAIIATQQNSPSIKPLYARIKNFLEYQIQNNKIPKHILLEIANMRNISFVYNLEKTEITNKAEAKKLFEAGLASDTEIKVGNYLKIELMFDYVFDNPSDVFRYISNFGPSIKAVQLAQSSLI
jgi:hypothetical protein